MLETVVHWLTETIFRLGYPGIAVLMAIESSFFPFPSEVVLPPAGFLAAQGRMNAFLALGSGVVGSLAGALFNYYLARALGRPLLHRYHRWFLVSEAKLVRAEEFFRRHGEISTFVGRLVPVIRQLISLPAGIARMRLDRFLLYTGLGAGIWCVVLTGIGYAVGRHTTLVTGIDALMESPEIRKYTGLAAIVLMPLLALVVLVYVLRTRRRQGRTG
ncbi:MAG: DedA family protein [Gemmatimonadales bacterium]|nr:DedA family protein [Gemmatimonadales bacterium]